MRNFSFPGQNATSRAYINFINEEDIFIFKDRFDGYVFVETKGGVEYPAMVEFAPFQGLPKSKSRKKDNKCNTIETDPDFIKFLNFLNSDTGEGKPEMKMEYSYQIKDGKLLIRIALRIMITIITFRFQKRKSLQRHCWSTLPIRRWNAEKKERRKLMKENVNEMMNGIVRKIKLLNQFHQAFVNR